MGAMAGGSEVRRSLCNGAAVLLLALLAPVRAAVVAYDLPAPATGNQNYDGRFGMDFTVLQPIRVVGLGAFDSDANGIAASVPAGRNVEISLWLQTGPTTGTRLTSLEFVGAGDPLLGGHRFRDLASPLELAPGTYTIAAACYGTEPLWNDSLDPTIGPARALNGGGALAFGLARYAAGAAFTEYPNNVGPFGDFVSSNQYYLFLGPSFSYELVPEPATALLLPGAGALLACRRRRRGA